MISICTFSPSLLPFLFLQACEEVSSECDALEEEVKQLRSSLGSSNPPALRVVAAEATKNGDHTSSSSTTMVKMQFRSRQLYQYCAERAQSHQMESRFVTTLSLRKDTIVLTLFLSLSLLLSPNNPKTTSLSKQFLFFHCGTRSTSLLCLGFILRKRFWLV